MNVLKLTLAMAEEAPCSHKDNGFKFSGRYNGRVSWRFNDKFNGRDSLADSMAGLVGDSLADSTDSKLLVSSILRI